MGIKFQNHDVPDEEGKPTEDLINVSDDTYALILEIRKLAKALRSNR